MTTKADFSPEEWSTITQGLMVAGMYITLASPSITDSVKESFAMSNTIAKSLQGSHSELLTSLLSEFKDRSAIKAAQPKFEGRDIEAVKTQAVEKVRQAAAILQQKAKPEEVTEVKNFLYQVAVATAEAAKEGDFLGIGGKRVSEEEQQALARLADVLGIQA